MATNRKNITSRNSLCKANGHAWRLSSSGKFRVCEREYCTAQEQLDVQQGAWVEAPTVAQRAARARRAQQQHQPAPVAFATSLWAHQERIDDPALWCDRASERRAEHSYHRLLGRNGGMR